MTTPSSTAAINKQKKVGTVRVLMLITFVSSLLILLWSIGSIKPDPFLKETLAIEGSIDAGSKLFKINCVGCHGISAQGLVGPDLHGVTNRLSDKKIVNQVIRGLTPPMPSFEVDSKSMADLLAYMYSLDSL